MQSKQVWLMWLAGLAVAITVVGGALSYFFWMKSDGRIDVKAGVTQDGHRYSYLLRGEVHHGMAFEKPFLVDVGNPDRDFSRLATTYYHRRSPIGMVMQRFDWFGQVTAEKRSHNVFPTDARLPASIVAMGAPLLGHTCVAHPAILAVWPEPPVGVVGLDVGTMASYARPFQHMHFYEENEAIRELSWPKPGKAVPFGYALDASGRGAGVRRFAGDERKALATQAPDRFYHVLVVECGNTPKKALLSKEAMQLMVDKLAERGILCYHTSNRFYDLPPLLANLASDLGLATRVGHDNASHEPGGSFFVSEWTMVARKAEYLADLREPDGHAKGPARPGAPAFWTVPATTRQPRLTDKQPGALAEYLRANP